MAKSSRVPGSPGTPDTSSTRGAAKSPINAHAITQKLIPPPLKPPMGVTYKNHGKARRGTSPAEAS